MQYVRQLIDADFDICCFIELTVVFIWFLDMDPDRSLVAKTVQTANFSHEASTPLNQVLSPHNLFEEMFPRTPPNIDLPAFTMHLPTIVSLPQTPNHALMPPSTLTAKDRIKLVVSKVITKGKHRIEPSLNMGKLAIPTNHAVHRTAGPVLEHIAQQQHSNPNESTTNQDHTQETLLMQSRQNKRRPRTQECGDQETPEFKQHNKYQVADEADEGPESDDDL